MQLTSDNIPCRNLQLCTGFCLFVLCAGWCSDLEADEGSAFFEKKIRPVLVSKCYSCHSAEAAKKQRLKGRLQLDTREGIRAGGESGPAVVPGNLEKSLIVESIRRESFEMPPDEKLPDDVIADFVRWIEMGAPDPRSGQPVALKKGIDYEVRRNHWAYQPLKPAVVPKVENSLWSRGTIDRYLLAKIEEAGSKPAGDAESTTILRRLCFDLTGLSPTVDQVKHFEKLSHEEASRAYEKLVDKLIESPQFGEHWARHWLDGIRYNPQLETSAYYRNWVINAFNSDLPYNDFLRYQIAGDLLPIEDDSNAANAVIATQMIAYNRTEDDFIEATLEVVGQQMLGISLNCAKCHDHKYDAVSQEDYYALAGIFTSCKVPKSARDGDALPGTKTKVISVSDERPNKIGPTHLLIGGDKSRRGELIQRRLPKVFFHHQPPRIESTKSSGRLELAAWIGDPNNPLTARVMVNRMWQRLMGRGIVTTPNDFGENGDPPTHPHLLDYLADQFIRSGWSVKKIIREIVLSRAYRQSVHVSRENETLDPTNEYFTRAVPKRLQYEQIMDQMLMAAGRLELGMIEPVPSINKWPMQRQKDKSYGGPRTIYSRADSHMEQTFDGPNPELLVTERARSVTAPQALLLLNSEMVRNLSKRTAERVQSMGNQDPTTLIHNAYRVLFARLPTPQEKALGLEFIQKRGFDHYVHALFCTNEFIHLN